MFKQFLQLASTGQGAMGVLSHLSSGEVRNKVNEVFGGNDHGNDVFGAMIAAARSDTNVSAAILEELGKSGNSVKALAAGEAVKASAQPQQQSQAGNQQTGNQQQGTQQQGGQQQNQQQGGELIIPHKPGEIISPGGVILAQERRTRPPEPPTQP
jgi:hypothetical protein